MLLLAGADARSSQFKWGVGCVGLALSARGACAEFSLAVSHSPVHPVKALYRRLLLRPISNVVAITPRTNAPGTAIKPER
jgi:hypothetical protein